MHLAREPKDITLWGIYQAVDTNDAEKIFKLHETGSDCHVGESFYQILLPHMVTVINAMRANMEQVTLETLMNELKQLIKDSPVGNRPQDSTGGDTFQSPKTQELSTGPGGSETTEL